MNRLIFMLCAALLLAVPLVATNHLNMLYTLEGEFIGSRFGHMTVSMDFNGDGHDDLIVVAPDWNSTGVYNEIQRWGKIYFFWGGPSFDNVADFTIEGTHNRCFNRFRYGYINAGDMNGDGIDDLMVTTGGYSQYEMNLLVYFGTSTPSISPDITYTYQDAQSVELFALGDINGDNKDDVAISCGSYSSIEHHLNIWDDVYAEPWLFRHIPYDFGIPSISGVGDVTGDGYCDAVLQTSTAETFEIKRYVLLKGAQDSAFSDSLVLNDYASSYPGYFGSPLGDINGDGVGDFSVYDGRVWLGSPNLSAIHDFHLNYYIPNVNEWNSLEENTGYPLIYADLNSDGYDDIIGSCSSIGSGNGRVGIWMGKANPNGITDLYLYNPANFGYRCFGWSKAVGDFNSDGTPDLAISAPFWYQEEDYLSRGNVFIYTGNTQLADTTVANEDELMPMESNHWKLQTYPNPISTTAALRLCYLGDGYSKISSKTITIYNLKGQKVHQAKDISNSNEYLLKLPLLPSGVFFVTVGDGTKILQQSKIVVAK